MIVRPSSYAPGFGAVPWSAVSRVHLGDVPSVSPGEGPVNLPVVPSASPSAVPSASRCSLPSATPSSQHWSQCLAEHRSLIMPSCWSLFLVARSARRWQPLRCLEPARLPARLPALIPGATGSPRRSGALWSLRPVLLQRFSWCCAQCSPSAGLFRTERLTQCCSVSDAQRLASSFPARPGSVANGGGRGMRQ
jgi:hypothetical protein